MNGAPNGSVQIHVRATHRSTSLRVRTTIDFIFVWPPWVDALIRRRPLDMIDDENLNWSFRWL
jgi:hypothetical protein